MGAVFVLWEQFQGGEVESCQVGVDGHTQVSI